MTLDLVICGKAFINGKLEDTEIGVTDGKIVYIGSSAGKRKTRINTDRNQIILPGGIDPHVHFRDPGLSYKEDFESGSRSAIFGGITCVLDMPNTEPPIVDRNSLVAKKEHIKGRSYCDYGLLAAITEKGNPSEVADSVAGYKLYMGSTTGNILVNDDKVIDEKIREVIKTGKVLSVHAEDDNMIADKHEQNCTDHQTNRPVSAELNAIHRLAKFKNEKINICHTSSPDGLNLANSFGFTTEVTMHHLLLSSCEDSDTKMKVNPPLREASVRDGLFNTFKKGKATMFGSDHAPHTIKDKNQDFNDAPCGIPGVETTFPLLMNMVREEIIPLGVAVEMCSTAPARVFGMNKGSIEIGKDADFAIFNLQKNEKIRGTEMHSKAGQTPFEGWEAVFPDTVILRGKVQLMEREFCGELAGVDLFG